MYAVESIKAKVSLNCDHDIIVFVTIILTKQAIINIVNNAKVTKQWQNHAYNARTRKSTGHKNHTQACKGWYLKDNSLGNSSLFPLILNYLSYMKVYLV